MFDPLGSARAPRARDDRGHGAGHGTRSVCPVCLAAIPAQRCRRGDDVVLRKACPDHGAFETVLWRGGYPAFADWKSPKTPSAPRHCHTQGTGNCPHDCGLCPDHGQHTCTALLEITQHCNLRCPVCFAGAGDHSSAEQADPGLPAIAFWYDRVIEASGHCNIQLSGGEPTVRHDLPAIIALGRAKGFSFIQLNTNGLRLADDPAYARTLRQAGLASVFLQCDGVDDAVYAALRGRPLWAIKQRAVRHAVDAGLGVVLVATVAPGVNDGQLGALVRYALTAGPLVRGVHFQPISYFGRYAVPGARAAASAPHAGPPDAARITLPDIMRGLETQTHGMVRVAHCRPPGCEHALCSFHASYVRTAQGGLRRLAGDAPCCGPKPAPPSAPSASPPSAPPSAVDGARRSIAYTARQWAAPPARACAAPGTRDSAEKNRTPASLSGQGAAPGPAQAPTLPGAPGTGMSLDAFLEQARTWTFSVSAMAFQDAWTLDLERLKGCCIHVVAPDGRLVPFCAYNLTAADGRPLYRGQSEPPCQP
ncbi:MAG: radical SAM (seleno)protein TrsS [Desulfovibrionaceae bacterium]